MSTSRLAPASLAASTRSRVPWIMTRSNASRIGAGQERNEMDDRVAALDGAAEAGGVGHVSLHDLAAPGAELVLLLRAPGERAHGQLRRPQRVDDGRADEPGSSGDEDHSIGSSSSSGSASGLPAPGTWSPDPRVPYGCSAGSVSCTKESWPIFIP